MAAAARALDLAQPTLGRQVAALEDELGVVLFERGARSLVLTQNGLELLEHVRTMSNAANRLSLAASGQSLAIDGRVFTSATMVAAAFVLPSLAGKLRQLAPGIEIELIAHRLRSVNAHLYGATGYLERLGNPQSTGDFADASFIAIDNSDHTLNLLNARGLALTSKNFPVLADNRLVQWELVRQGVVIGIMPQEIGDADPLLARVLPDLDPLVGELWLVTHCELNTNRRIRTVFDFLATELSIHD